MSKLINSTTMTVDAVTDVGEWYVAGGEHTRTALQHFHEAEAMVLGAQDVRGSRG